VITAKYGPAGNLLTAVEIFVDEIAMTSSGKSFVWHASEEEDATTTSFANALLQTSSLEEKVAMISSYAVLESSEDSVFIKVIGTITAPDVVAYALPAKSNDTCLSKLQDLPNIEIAYLWFTRNIISNFVE
jgi:hypothetical protein